MPSPTTGYLHPRPAARGGSRPARSTPSSSPSPTCRGGCRASGCTAHYFLDVVLEHGTEGCNYLLAVDVDMNTVDGYAISSWERGLRRHGVRARPATRSGCSPHLPGDRDGAVRPGLARRHAPVVAVAAHDPQGAARPGRRARAASRWPAPSSSSSSSTTPTRTACDRGYRDLTAGQPVQRRLLDPRHHPGRAAAARHPQRACTPPGMDVEGAKGECNFGQHEIGFLYDDALVTADNHAVYKTGGQGDRRPARPVAHLHGQVRRARGQLLPHPPVAARRRRRASSSGTTTATAAAARSTTSFVAGLLATHARLHAASTRRTSTPTSGSPPARSRRPPIAWGPDNRTCAVRLVGHGPGCADGEPGARRRRQPLPRARGDARRRPARHRAASWSSRPRWSATPTPPTSRTCRDTLREARDAVRGSAPSPGRPSATRSSTTTPTWPTSSSRPSTPRSPTGSCVRGFERM